MSLPFEDILSIEPYSLAREEKRALLLDRLRALTALHYAQCEPYHRMLDAQSIIPDSINNIEDFPLSACFTF